MSTPFNGTNQDIVGEFSQKSGIEMEKKEPTTQQRSPSSENLSANKNNVNDSSPTTPGSTSAAWWGGWLSQAKEKVSDTNQ